jgi:hypothetical protein
MKFNEKNPSRCFSVGLRIKSEMRDCGSLLLEPDEQVTFITDTGGEYDIARKEWGFYATPSLNGRLESFGLRGVLIRNRLTHRYFVLLVERGRESSFDAYLKRESCDIISWLDSTEALERLRIAVTAGIASS